MSNSSVCPLQARKEEKSRKSLARSHETYRLLRRKNLIVEAVRSLKIIEGLFPSVCLKLLSVHLKGSKGANGKCQHAVFLQVTEDNQRRRETGWIQLKVLQEDYFTSRPRAVQRRLA